MLPWIFGTVMAAVLFPEEDEEELDAARRKLLGLERREGEPSRKREMSFLQMWGGCSPHPLWSVETDSGYVGEIYNSESDAIRSAKMLSKQDEGVEQIQVIKHVMIPIGLWEDLQLVGKKNSPFEDGHEIGTALGPYQSKEVKDGVVFSWDLHDEAFKNWPDTKKKEEIERVFDENAASSDLPAGMKLYLMVEDDEPWLDEIEQQRKEEETGEDAETYLIDPIFASNSRETAPVFPGTAYDRKFLVTVQLEQPIPRNRIVFVPWSDPTGELSRVLETSVDSKENEEFDPESISDKFTEIRKDDRKHWGPIALQVQTDDNGAFILFFWPYPTQESRYIINKTQVRVRVLSVEQI